MAPGSGPVPVETSVCLIRGSAMGGMTAGMAVMRLDVSVGVPIWQGYFAHHNVVFSDSTELFHAYSEHV